MPESAPRNRTEIGTRASWSVDGMGMFPRELVAEPSPTPPDPPPPRRARRSRRGSPARGRRGSRSTMPWATRSVRRAGIERRGRRSSGSAARSMPSARRRPISSISSPSSSRVSTSSTTSPSPRDLDLLEPGLGLALGRRRVAAVGQPEPAVGAGADAGIFAVAPVDEIVPALGARPRVVGDLVGRQARPRRRPPA